MTGLDEPPIADARVVVEDGRVAAVGPVEAVADAAVTHAEEPRVGVGAHSHVVEDEEFELFEAVEEIDGSTVRVLNPGSATGTDPADAPTTMTAEVAAGDLDVTVHEA